MGDQAPEVARAERRTGGTMELFRLQQVISELGRQEKRLRLQRAQLEDYIARYEQQATLAQEAKREDVAEEALALSRRLQAYLPALQQHMAALQSRREPLIQQQQDLLARLGAAFQQEEAADRPDDQEGAPQPRLKPPVPAPRRASRKLLAALCALVVMVVVTPLALLRGHGLGHPPASATQGHPTPTLPPPPSPITFTAAGTAPTSQDCQNNVGTACYSPEQIQRAFHLTALYQQGYDGQGQTIVIVGAGHSVHLKQDLHQFDLAWGLPDPPSFQILQPRGAPAPYDCGLGGDALELENTLDVEWSHAIAPGANIVLLIWPNGVPDAPPQANCGIIGLDGAVAYALDHQLGQIISISYGGSELGDLSETAADKADDQRLYARGHAIFQRAAAERVTVLAATGDNGVTNPDDFTHPGSFWPTPNVSWPASDPYVLAVGGTQLQLADAAGDRGSEQVWNEGKAGGATGGGLSAVFAEPDYQKALPNQHMLKGRRGLPDVAFPAALNYSLYASSSAGALGKANPARWNHWDVIGGTSASTPCWAGLIALADQLEGSSLGLIQPALYALGGQGMNDITQSDNSFGGVPGYKALPGYDLATGWGTPIADQFIPALLAVVNRAGQSCLGSVRACS